MSKSRFQDLEIWKMSIEIANSLFDIAESLDTKRLYRFALCSYTLCELRDE